MTKLLRLTFIAFAVIALATVIVSMPLPVNERWISYWYQCVELLVNLLLILLLRLTKLFPNLNKRRAPPLNKSDKRPTEPCHKRKRCPPPLGGGGPTGPTGTQPPPWNHCCMISNCLSDILGCRFIVFITLYIWWGIQVIKLVHDWAKYVWITF